jgi:hypothetical protein
MTDRAKKSGASEDVRLRISSILKCDNSDCSRRRITSPPPAMDWVKKQLCLAVRVRNKFFKSLKPEIKV